MKILPAIREKYSDWEEIEQAIIRLMVNEFFDPLLREIRENEKILKNTNDGLFDAIVKGKVTFDQGRFHSARGGFNSTLTRELRRIGAEWDRRTRTFAIPHSRLPREIQHAIAVSEQRFSRMIERLQKRLRDINPDEVASKFEGVDLFEKTLWKTEKKIQAIVVSPKLTPDQMRRVSYEYTKNMQLYIRNFTNNETTALRKNIQNLVERGGRSESVIKEIQDRYQVTRNKAKFLARQETSLMITKFRQVRYQSAGITHYVWECVKGSPAHPVRHFHKLNDGKTFRYDTGAPINAQGDRKNPGQDYNCRCIDRPIVRFTK